MSLLLSYNDPLAQQIRNLYANLCTRIAGKRGAPTRRTAFEQAVNRREQRLTAERKTANYHTKRIAKAAGLARMAERFFDEHGTERGDIRSTQCIDYIDPHTAQQAPYLDMGHAGLGLIRIKRIRTYAGHTWRPSTATDSFLVGRNEAGTFFAHSVPNTVSTIKTAINWIWSGHADDIICRQGDIAICKGRGRRLPRLPFNHRIEGNVIKHPTHPTIHVPKRGEFLIVGRRAATHVSNNSRD